MDMQMKYHLTRLLSVIDHNPEFTCNAVFRRDLGAYAQKLADKGIVAFGHGRRRADVLFGDNQEVLGGLGRYIPERQGIVVLIKLLYRDLTCDDLTE
jgi:hypothetical protein